MDTLGLYWNQTDWYWNCSFDSTSSTDTSQDLLLQLPSWAHGTKPGTHWCFACYKSIHLSYCMLFFSSYHIDLSLSYVWRSLLGMWRWLTMWLLISYLISGIFLVFYIPYFPFISEGSIHFILSCHITPYLMIRAVSSIMDILFFPFPYMHVWLSFGLSCFTYVVIILLHRHFLPFPSHN